MKGWHIAKKDLRLLLRDRRTLVVLLVLPLIFITIIGLTTGQLLGWRSANQIVRVVWVDEVDYRTLDGPPGGLLRDPARQRHLVVKLLDAMQAERGLQVSPAPGRDEARRMATGEQALILPGDRNARASAALIIGPDFARRAAELEVQDIASVDTGRLAAGLGGLDLELVSAHPGSTTHAIIEQLVFAQALKAVAPYVFCGHRTSDLGQNVAIRRRCRGLEDEASLPVPDPAPPVEIESEGDVQVYKDLIPSYTVLFAFFLVNIMGRSFIHERDLGTLRRLRIAPVRPSSLLLGKTFPFLMVSLAQIALLFVCGRLLFGMSWGAQPWLLAPVILCTSLAATSLGLLVATIVRTDAQVSAYGNSVVLIMAGISGCFMPRDWLPDMMQTISLATPHAWALIAYNNILTMERPDLGLLARCGGMLLAFTAAFFAIGAWRLRSLD